ncbi:hypothetical protein [Nocardia nova]|nr:hypothetical protein [Nocardia nova]
MSTKQKAPQVNPIVQAAADRVRKAKRRKAKISLPTGNAPASWDCSTNPR